MSYMSFIYIFLFYQVMSTSYDSSYIVPYRSTIGEDTDGTKCTKIRKYFNDYAIQIDTNRRVKQLYVLICVDY